MKKIQQILKSVGVAVLGGLGRKLGPKTIE